MQILWFVMVQAASFVEQFGSRSLKLRRSKKLGV